ncbi:MAG: tRNA (guanosine(46)-N7)-methyltransferase TrmB [Treponema sp.]|jgi:tRNA (guanine-N7-)-methyltransferase|nr:tRNA (guanosine(46)-N7)-methyltransferase TrmB [Treponema sp.]
MIERDFVPLPIKSYVIRSGRISDAQKRAYRDLLPLYGVPPGIIDFRALFSNSNPVTVEIGFGSGSATAVCAASNPSMNYVGIEVHKPGIGRLLWEIEQRGLNNIRIIEGDAAVVLSESIYDSSVSAFHIFFPDPWPKKRHHKRRLISRPFTDILSAKLQSGGYIALVTDWQEYATWILKAFSDIESLENPYGDFAPPLAWRPMTHFEQKGIQEGRPVWEIYLVKR